VRFLPREAKQSMVMPQYIYCPSIYLGMFVTPVGIGYFENIFMAEYIKASARADTNMGNLVQREHPQN